MINVSKKSCREDQNTYLMFKNFFPKIMPLQDNVEKHGGARLATDGNILQRTHALCKLDNKDYRHTLKKNATLIAFPQQQWLYNSDSMLHLYKHSLSS
jgi:hypothetical protein